MRGEAETVASGAYRAEIGYAYPDVAVSVTGAEQRRLHDWCGIPPQRYGEFADPTFVGRPPILLNTTTVRAAYPDWAAVHTIQRMRQLRPIRLEETLRMSGRITALLPHPRGTVMRSEWLYRDQSEAIVFVVEPDVLMRDPAARPRSADERPPSLPEHWQHLARYQCTPETTLGYCAGSENPIHFDLDYARAFGLRAPIIAGMQTINFLLAPLAEEVCAGMLEMTIRFQRPVFWDDALRIEMRRATASTPRALRAVNDDARCVADCTLHAVSHASIATQEQ